MSMRGSIGSSVARQTRLRMRVTAAAQSRLRAGHPWLFAGSIRDQNREGGSGELAVIYDRNDRFLAVGLFDPHSPIRVRILQTGKAETIDRVWWSRQLTVAVERRVGILDQETTGCRLVHGETDRFPGLVIDRYAKTLVLKLYTAAWMPRQEEIVEIIQEQLQPERIVLRLSRNVQQQAKPGQPQDADIISGSPLEEAVNFRETGLQFEADVLRGQKTGFFLDQRENRRRVEALAQNRTVLNAFSFSGGFSIYSARGGAITVTDLDVSAHALAAAKRNFALNESIASVAECCHEVIQADAFEWLAGNGRRKFDLVVLDPPSLAKRESERTGAIHAYYRLATLGLQHLAAGGVLVACSCSAHVSADEFFNAVRRAAADAKRKFSELETTRQPPDHPAGFPEAEYLKAIYLKF